MSTNQATLIDVPSTFRSLFWPVAIGLALLLGLLWLLGYGPGGSACRVPAVAAEPAAAVVAAAPEPAAASLPAAPAPAPSPAPAPAPEPVAAPAAAAIPAAKFYFDTNRVEVKTDERAKADAVIAHLKANSAAKAVVTGFHDPRGSVEANAALAKNRAKAVAGLLERAGIAKDRIELVKPTMTDGGGDLAEARRVELSVKP